MILLLFVCKMKKLLDERLYICRVIGCLCFQNVSQNIAGCGQAGRRLYKAAEHMKWLADISLTLLIRCETELCKAERPVWTLKHVK